MKPLISIIIATFNSEKTIKDALQSVIQQSFQDWECIVVDGASRDNTIKIVESFEKKDFRIRHISERDNGIYDAFNKGWKLSKGEWIHYLGSDDLLVSDGFEKLMSIPLDSIGVVTGDVYIKKIDGTIKPNISDGFGGCHQGKLVRRSVIERMSGFNEQYRILADYDLMTRMNLAGIKVLNVHVFVAYFAMDGVSQASVMGEWKRFKERVLIHRNNKLEGNAVLKNAVISFRIILSIFYRRFLSKLV